LTPNYIKNIRRSIETLNLDQVVKVIYMTGGRGEHFSNGTDFRTLLHYKKEGQEEKIAAYLEELYGLQIQTSKLNKPLISVAPGHSYNSGAAFLQSSGMPTVTLDSKLSFNEATFGFVPHGGTSFYLSRMPGEIGTFLALTGFPITGIDAKSFGIADELVHYSAAFEEEICDTLFAMEFPIPNGDLISNKGRFNPWRERIVERKKAEEEHYMAAEYEKARKKH
jgi:enoyl-CoA hydratase/carnithine racemase